ncbi:unnamed protein product [Closterium sp. Naga37s-1]|nr:unnamed protein product [Closterium sp. Naga37s-1]
MANSAPLCPPFPKSPPFPSRPCPPSPSLPAVPFRQGGHAHSSHSGHPQAWFTQYGELGPALSSRSSTLPFRQGGHAHSSYSGHPQAWFTQYGELGPALSSRSSSRCPYTPLLPLRVSSHLRVCFAVPFRQGGHAHSSYSGHPQAWFTQYGELGPALSSRSSTRSSRASRSSPLSSSFSSSSSPLSSSLPPSLDSSGPEAPQDYAYYSQTYKYLNQHSAALLWYRDRTQGMGRLNLIAGMAGLYVVWSYLKVLPALHRFRLLSATNAHFFNLSVVCALFFPSLLPPLKWSVVLIQQGYRHAVLSMVWPYLKVRPALHRFRLLSAANARFFNLSLVCADRKDYPNLYPPLKGGRVKFAQISSDAGYLVRPSYIRSLLPAPGEQIYFLVDFSSLPSLTLLTFTLFTLPGTPSLFLTSPLTSPKQISSDAGYLVRPSYISSDAGYLVRPSYVRSLLLAPGERKDILVDFSSLPSFCRDVINPLPPINLSQAAQHLWKMLVSVKDAQAENPLPRINLSQAAQHRWKMLVSNPLPPINLSQAAQHRWKMLVSFKDAQADAPLRVLIDNAGFKDAPTEAPRVGTYEVWHIVNLSPIAHPIRIPLALHCPISN